MGRVKSEKLEFRNTKRVRCPNCNYRQSVLLEDTAPEVEAICYSPCEKHMGQTFTLQATYCPPMKIVCPGCNPPNMNGGSK